MNSSPGRVVMLVLAIVVGGVAVLFLGDRWVWTPYRDASNRIDALGKEVDKKEGDISKLNLDKANLAKWNKLSLHKDADRAAAEYGKMLKPLLRDCGLTVEDFQGPPPQEAAGAGNQKKPKHIVLPFQVTAKGSIEALAKTLEKLQRTPVMHRVKTLIVDRLDAKDRTGRLRVQMTIEAMIVAGADNVPKLGSADLLPPPTKRAYQEVALRNPFLGYQPPPVVQVKKEIPEPEDPPGPNVLEFIHIDTIVPTSKEAFLRNRLLNKPPQRLKSTPMSGYDTFRILDDAGKPVVKGRVLRIDERDIFFQVKDIVYRFHFGQSLAEAMRRPLNDAQIDGLELTALVDADFGKDDVDLKKATPKKNNVTKKR